MFQNTDETTIVSSRALHTTHVSRDVVLNDAFAQSFFDLPGKAILINTDDARGNVARNADFETVGQQGAMLFPGSLESTRNSLDRYHGSKLASVDEPHLPPLAVFEPGV